MKLQLVRKKNETGKCDSFLNNEENKKEGMLPNWIFYCIKLLIKLSKLPITLEKSGSCEICDEKFDDEDAHVLSARHQACLDKKRHQFERVLKSCSSFFPNGIDGFLNRLDEFNAGPVPSPMPISVLTEPDSELSLATAAESPVKTVVNEIEIKMETKEDNPQVVLEKEATEAAYRETKVESSFETKEPEKEDEEELEEDWMFNNMTSKAPSRKVSHESGADSMMDEVEMLQAKVQNIPTELSEAPSVPSEPVKRSESEKKDQLKRKSTPAKGTYNPSNMGVLDQLASSSCSKAHFDSKSDQNSAPSPIISTLKQINQIPHRRQLEQSPKPPPLPLNLDAASRSPALKKVKF